MSLDFSFRPNWAARVKYILETFYYDRLVYLRPNLLQFSELTSVCSELQWIANLQSASHVARGGGEGTKILNF